MKKSALFVTLVYFNLSPGSLFWKPFIFVLNGTKLHLFCSNGP